MFDPVWQEGHRPFARLNTETFLAVSPWRIVLWTCNPEAVLQITSRRNDFVKPVTDLAVLNIYGPTVTATEGEESKYYRKITASSLGQRTYQTTWKESLEKTQLLLQHWQEGKSTARVRDINHGPAKLTLLVISKVCLGRGVSWNDDNNQGSNSRNIARTTFARARRNKQHYRSLEKSHSMGYHEAFKTSLDYMGVIYLTPYFLLSRKARKDWTLRGSNTYLGYSPLRLHQIAWTSFVE